ncbi:beta-ribofuranosylaminobenzene 5'-phosphate synthase family protein [Sulfolobus acidocaldarius]|nr:beta-ribofuranosylaminobenzene 5'-phosphate synthase family protein [Sulfolobus acidocaldarius]AGE71406.1 hypothetical protein SacN8_07210 [Sulfolobus acidocaldarius N8]AGE73677.1 hypothetical protein SacRon12I_07210 [Sulfolobus acidocaldarius Ron12/I]ALU30351.1 beta-ribofuranosylaminobenzene 5'-phosphate synthase [Sulfolobus acidocaldarius]ALU31069.1 beta-ribofuranosylaminobenzene 5'-phosphate synthase [Sulfolobus acidocaldarius]WCM35316.1 beta-ribofuranosylaminobenzene 5'-phosphate syntha
MIRVIGLSRIHITLLDLEGLYGRIDGGVGVALKYPRVVMRNGDCTTVNISLPFRMPSVCIEEDYEAHVGLGHTTQFLLSAAKLAAEYNLKNVDVVDLARIVKRGGTSGVGVYAFKYGGFIVDAGHSVKVKQNIAPSDFSDAPPPPLMTRYSFPWYIYINTPSYGRRIFGVEELNAFKKEVKGTSEVIRVTFMELVPAVIDHDISSALDAIAKIQNLGFKRIEVNMQTEQVRDLMKSMYNKGFPAGISSFGPTVYTFVNTKREGEELVSYFGGLVTEPNNEGAKVIWSKD